MKMYTLSRKTRWRTGVVLSVVILLFVGACMWTTHWFLLICVLPLCCLLYDICAFRCVMQGDTITLRTARYPCGKTFRRADFKDVKIDRFYPWGRVVLIPKSGKRRHEVYLWCEHPVAFRQELASFLKP